MKKGTVIIAIVVVALLVGGGIAAAGMMGLFGEKDNKVSFDKNYFDLSGAKSLAIKQDNQTSSKVNAVSLSTGGSVYAFGDDDDDVVSTTFYKKTDSGWVKVRMYTDDSKSEEVSYESSPFVMDVTTDGKFAFMVFGELNNREYRNVTYVVVSLVSGKIYELPDDTNHRVQFNSSKYNSTLKYYDTSPVSTMNDNQCHYRYLGSTDSVIYLTTRILDNDEYHIFVATESNGELNFNEIFSNEAMASNEVGNILFYKNGIMRVLHSDPNNHKESWIVFQNGYLKKCNEDELDECEGYLCTEVTYSNTYFPTSAKRITGLSGSNFTTDTVSYDTDAKSYNAAKNTLQTNQIFKKENANDTVIVLMNKVNKIQRLTLKNDCTFTLDDEVALTDDYKLNTLPGWTENGGVIDDSSGGGGGPDKYYCIVTKHICQGTCAVGKVYGRYAPSSTIVSDDGKMYLAVNEAVKKYDLLTYETGQLSVENLAEAKSLDADGDRIIISGLSTQGKSIKGTLDFSTGKVDTSEQDILKEYTIKAVN